MADERRELFEKVGGREGILRIAKNFYDKVYDHPWMKLYFQSIPQEHIENQQTDFMSGSLGGQKVYMGRFPVPAHEHMYITEELFELRNKILLEALHETHTAPEVIEAWLKIDNAFKKRIVKNNRLECKKRYFTDGILDFENPATAPTRNVLSEKAFAIR
jgi:hemoglobin